MNTHTFRNDTIDLNHLHAYESQMEADLQARMRAARSDGRERASEDIDRSDAVIQGEMDFALIEMKADALVRLREESLCLDAGLSGSCLECQIEIPEARRRALPFAVRCRGCEELRERRRQNQHGGHRRASLVSDAIGS